MKPSDDAQHKTETSMRDLKRKDAPVAHEQERAPEGVEDATR
jgi:hypothetical protein